MQCFLLHNASLLFVVANSICCLLLSTPVLCRGEENLGWHRNSSHHPPQTTTTSLSSSASSPRFGRALLLQRSPSSFLLNYTNFNHGSFGACPGPVLEYQRALRWEQEQQPDPFLRVTYKELWNNTRSRIADSLQVPYRQLVLLESASTAVNSIMRSLPWRNGDIILYFSTAYGMVKNTAKWLQNQFHIQIVEVPITFPIVPHGDGNDAYLGPLGDALQQLQQDQSMDKLKLAVLDHIVSIPAIKLPVRAMATMIRQYAATNNTDGVPNKDSNPFILVDGAHAWGQVPNSELTEVLQLNFQNDGNSINAFGTTTAWIDAYLSNGHKWMYSPKGSAIMWVHPSRISNIFPEPTVISSENSLEECNGGERNVDDDPLYHRFVYTSTKDYTAILSIGKAMDFRKEVLGGDDLIYKYIRTLAIKAKKYLMEVWNSPIAMAPNSMEEYMINVILPISKEADNKTAVATELQQWLYSHQNMYVVVAMEPSSGYIYTRLSAQVYLEFQDFERLGRAVLEFLEESQGYHIAID